MSIFPGNTSESLTLTPTTGCQEILWLRRLIVVADKGINSSKNIDLIVNNGDGMSSLRCSKERKESVTMKTV